MAVLKNDLLRFTLTVAASLIAVVIVLILTPTGRKIRKYFCRDKSKLKKRARRDIKEIKKLFKRRHHPVIKFIVSRLLKRKTAHLFTMGKEDVSLVEYGELLRDSLEMCDREFLAVSVGLPSDWYEAGPSDIEEAQLALIKSYLKDQSKKRKSHPKLKMSRIVIADNAKDFEENRCFKDFFGFHKNNSISLYLCENKSLPDPSFRRDFALFEDRNGKWVVESANLDRRALSEGRVLKVRLIEDQVRLENQYSTMIHSLKRISKKLWIASEEQGNT